MSSIVSSIDDTIISPCRTLQSFSEVDLFSQIRKLAEESKIKPKSTTFDTFKRLLNLVF